MRAIAALVAMLALFAAASVPVQASESSVTFIAEELSAAEENDFAVESEADAAADEEEADEEYAKAEGEELNEVVDEAAQPALLEIEDEAEDEAEEEVDEEDAAEDELDAEVDAIDEDAVEEENADVFVETTDAAGSVLEWLNKARAADAEVLKELERRAGLFQGKLFVDGSLRLMTNEGVSAVNGAIKAMKAHKKIAALTKSTGLTKAAAAHVADIGPKGGFSHTGTDGSSPFDRMNRFGKWSKTAAENMGSGSNDGKSIVMQLLIDDGVSSRGHRTNILNKALAKVGIAVGSHKVYKYMTVMDFAGAYAEKK